MSISTEEVRYGYLFVLGREPESEIAIAWHAQNADIPQFRDALLRSEEFRAKYSALAPGLTGHPFATWDREAVAFIHVPKTGGTSLGNLLRECFCKDRICPERMNQLHFHSVAELGWYDYFAGHFDYMSKYFIPRQRVRCLSIFRDPINRLISLYRFSRSHTPIGEFAGNEMIRLANTLGIEEFFEHKYVTSLSTINNSYLFTFGSSLDDWTESLADEGFCTRTLARATNRIHDLDAIGVTERFSESVEIIFASLGIPVTRAIVPAMITDELPNSAMVTDELPNSNTRFAGVPPVVMTARLARALAPLTKYDQIIYDVARQEFERRRSAVRSAEPSSTASSREVVDAASSETKRGDRHA
jgi:hypothetical protein